MLDIKTSNGGSTMTDIEQRAKELYRHEHEDVCLGRDFYDEQSFIVGAKAGIYDQQKIDIDKAWKLVKETIERIYGGFGIPIDEDTLTEGYDFFKKAMEE